MTRPGEGLNRQRDYGVLSGSAGSGQMHTSHLGQGCLKPFAMVILTSLIK